MRTTLVTGATGFVGSHLAEELLARGQSIRALVRNPSQGERLRERGIEVIVGDIRDPDAVGQVVQGIDVILHCAGAVGDRYTGREIRETNLEGVRFLLEGARAASVGRVVLLSSVNVLGTIDLDPATEDLPCRRSHDPAADVKIEAERLVLEVAHGPGPEVVILRPGFIYGPGDPGNLPRIIRALRRGKFAYIGSRDHVIPIVQVDDVVQAILLAAQAPGADGRVYLITDGSRTTIGEFIDHLATLLGCLRPRRVLPAFIPRFACVVFDGVRLVFPRCPAPIRRSGVRFLGTSRYVDIRRAREELGYAPHTGYREGLAEVVRGLASPAEEKTHDYSLSR
ncbi:MAG: NAD-dependent epimerase/dehydratase family protein [Isosphaeraceae bacterium]